MGGCISQATRGRAGEAQRGAGEGTMGMEEAEGSGVSVLRGGEGGWGGEAAWRRVRKERSRARAQPRRRRAPGPAAPAPPFLARRAAGPFRPASARP